MAGELAQVGSRRVVVAVSFIRVPADRRVNPFEALTEVDLLPVAVFVEPDRQQPGDAGLASPPDDLPGGTITATQMTVRIDQRVSANG